MHSVLSGQSGNKSLDSDDTESHHRWNGFVPALQTKQQLNWPASFDEVIPACCGETLYLENQIRTDNISDPDHD